MDSPKRDAEMKEMMIKRTANRTGRFSIEAQKETNKSPEHRKNRDNEASCKPDSKRYKNQRTERKKLH